MTSQEEVAFAMLSEALHGYIEVMGFPRDSERHEDTYEEIIDRIIDKTEPT